METFKDYHDHVNETVKYSNVGRLGGLVYTTLGLAGEAGEIANKVKKLIRDDNFNEASEILDLPHSKVYELRSELGDVLWYMDRLADELDSSLAEVAQMNIDKLKSRLDRGKIQGSGDNR